MKSPTTIVWGSTTIDPTSPSLFLKTSPDQFSRDEVRLNPPRDKDAEINCAKSIIDSGRSLFLEMTYKAAK